jgi:hypothetical protein
VKILTYHLVAGRLSAADLKTRIRAGGGHAMLKTVADGTLTAMMTGNSIVLQDEKGGTATVTQANVFSVEWRDPRDRQRAAAQLIQLRRKRCDACSTFFRSLFSVH